MAESGKKDKGAAGADTIETISTAGGEQQQQLQIQVDDSKAPSTYSSTVRVWGSAEEINLDFAGPLRPSGPKTATIRVDQRIVLNPWAAKRLAISLNQAVARYEQAYGALEIDPRKRMTGKPAGGGAAATPTGPAGGKLS